MRVTDCENDRHSTAARDPLPRLRRRFFGSLVLIGLLVGVMIGRVTTPDPVQMLRVEAVPGGLQLWFDREPELYSQDVDGAVAMLFQAQGTAQRGRLDIDGSSIRWRLQDTESGLLLHFVATRPLRAEWKGQEVNDGWRLDVVIRAKAERVSVGKGR
jgi:hypothetical protein